MFQLSKPRSQSLLWKIEFADFFVSTKIDVAFIVTCQLLVLLLIACVYQEYLMPGRKQIQQQECFISNLQRCLVYLRDCVTKTADGVENESSSNEYIEIQTYTSRWKHNDRN